MFGPIITERLLIREMTESDVSLSYLHWLQDPEVNRFTEVRWQEITFKSLVDVIRQAKQAEDSAFLGTFDVDTGQHIGTLHITQISQVHQTAVIGFLIGEKLFWGKGLATEAIKAVTDLLLGQYKLRKVTAACYEGNRGSARALLKSGFTHEATHRHQLISGNVPVHELRFARFAADHEPGTGDGSTAF